jgi:hypothetical protein
MSSNGSIPLASLLIHICPHSTAVVQRFCKPKAGSSILSGGTSSMVRWSRRLKTPACHAGDHGFESRTDRQYGGIAQLV